MGRYGASVYVLHGNDYLVSCSHVYGKFDSDASNHRCHDKSSMGMEGVGFSVIGGEPRLRYGHALVPFFNMRRYSAHAARMAAPRLR